MIGMNWLGDHLEAESELMGGSMLFAAWNEGRRFKIEVDIQPSFEPNGSFVLTVFYQPWPRTDRGRRRKELPFEFGVDKQIVHAFETRSYRDLLSELELWIARCSAWMREGN